MCGSDKATKALIEDDTSPKAKKRPRTKRRVLENEEGDAKALQAKKVKIVKLKSPLIYPFPWMIMLKPLEWQCL